MAKSKAKKLSPWREKTYEIIFEANTPAGKLFDILLLWAILFSVLAVLLESVAGVRENYGPLLRNVEWGFTILFTIEYFLRIISVRKPLEYAKSFFGLVDLFSILPTYLSFIFVGSHSLIVIRGLRLLRIFRIFKLGRFISESKVLMTALQASRAKITVFIGTVLTLVLIIGAVMYLVEGETNGFTSIPKSVYWAIVTMTTVGYGDITPQTLFGQFLASFVMILGYAIIAVPTGIVSVELSRATDRQAVGKSCHSCGKEGLDLTSHYCQACGTKL